MSAESSAEEHDELIRQAQALLTEDRNRDAYSLYLRAHRRFPECPLIGLGLATALRFLDRDTTALAVCRRLEERGDESLLAGNPRMSCTVEEFRSELDLETFRVAQWVYFQEWEPTGFYLLRHLESRLEGMKSVYDWSEVRVEVVDFAEGLERVDPRLPELIEKLDKSSRQEEHEAILKRGEDLYHDDKTRESFPVLLKALRLQPECSMAAFTIARCLYHLERNQLSLQMTLGLMDRSDEELTSGCPGVEWTAEEFRLDLDYAAFLVLRELYDDWSPAGEYLLRHLEALDRGVGSIYEWENLCEVVEEFTEDCRTVDPRLDPLMKRLIRNDQRRKLIGKAREFSEEEDHRTAYPHFLKAWRTYPECALAAYEVIFTLYVLGRYPTALSALLSLEGWSDEELGRTTPPSERTVEEIRADLAFLGFIITKNLHSAWSPAGDYLLKNLEARVRGADPGFPWESWSDEIREFAEDPLTGDPKLIELIEILDRKAAGEADSDQE